MATNINDLISAAVIEPSLLPQTITAASPEGDEVDLGPGDGPCFGVQVVGAITAASELAGHMEESDDEESWDAIAGAAFEATTEPGMEVVRFLRSKRYVRWAGTFTNGEGKSAACTALVIQQCKTF